jgi:flagellar biosynthetic protein FliR
LGEWEAILEHVPPALLVIFRIGGLMIFGPVFGSPVIPVRVKVGLTFLAGLAVYPIVASEAAAGHELRLETWALVPIVASELLIGMIVGFVANIPMVGVQTGGLVMGQQMGLGFARFYNPGIDDEADVLGQALFFVALTGFLVMGGHEMMVRAVLESFRHVPLGAFALDLSTVDLLLGLLLASFELALRVATPVLAIIFLQSVAMGYTAKTVPQLNILSLGFPIRILVGIALVMLGLVVINEVMLEHVDEALVALFDWIEGLGP